MLLVVCKKVTHKHIAQTQSASCLKKFHLLIKSLVISQYIIIGMCSIYAGIRSGIKQGNKRKVEWKWDEGNATTTTTSVECVVEDIVSEDR